MKTTTCDKCGAEIRHHPMQQAVLPTYMIYRNDVPITGGITTVDLCDECQRRFADWLRNAPDQGAGQ